MKRILFSVFLVASGFQLSAQQVYDIRGVVADSASQQQLDYVTVGLKNDKNEPVKTVLTKADGSFVFAGLKPGSYRLAIVAMGYKTDTMGISLAGTVNLGIVYIRQQAASLDAVTVIADKPLVKMDIDKISYDLQADPESKVNSVLEMMRRVPLLSLDTEDNIQLKGSGSYRIMINGRPSAMLEKSPKDILRSMPASTIQSIEVITNPPARYDGEGLTGIINIVTVKKVDNGYNGNVNINHRFPAGGPGMGGSFNFKQGKWGVSANLGGSIYFSPLSTYSNVRTITGINPSVLRQNGDREYDSENGYASTQLSYEIDSLNLVSGQFAYNAGAFDLSGSLISEFKDPAGILEAYRLSNRNSGSRNGTDASLNYQLGFKSSKERLLTLSYRYLKYFDDRNTEVLLNDRINYLLPNYLQFNEGGMTEQTVQIDYVQPFKKVVIETGIKGIFRDNYSDFRYSRENSGGQYVPDPLLSNQYQNIQNVMSFYSSGQLKLKNWGIRAGVRLEQTEIDADFVSSATTIKQDYLNLLPSVSVSRTLKDNSTFTLGFSRRIQRPGIWELNPYVDRTNPNLEQAGNPGLRPVVANNFQLSFNRSKKTSLSVGLSHSFSNNAIQYVILYDPVTNINRFTVGNNGSTASTGMNLNIAHPLTSRWNVNFTTNLNHISLTGYVDGEPAENDGITGNFAVTTGYRFENGWRLNSNLNYLLTPYVNLQGSGIAIFFYGFSVNKDILKDKVSLSASLNNPFDKYMNFPNNIQGENYTILNSNRGYFRAYSFSLNYKFGKLKSPIAKNRRGINNDDVSGGGRGPQ